MRKNFYALLSISLFFIANISNAQFGLTGRENIIKVGGGYGLDSEYGQYRMPPIFVTYEYVINSKFSVGGLFGYAISNDNSLHSLILNFKNGYGEPITYYFDDSNGADYNYYLIGVNGSYYFYSDHIFDFYSKFGIIINITHALNINSGEDQVNSVISYFKGNYSNISVVGFNKYTPGKSYLLADLKVGMNVYFSKYVGGFIEAGYGLSYVSAGIAVKFKGY